MNKNKDGVCAVMEKNVLVLILSFLAMLSAFSFPASASTGNAGANKKADYALELTHTPTQSTNFGKVLGLSDTDYQRAITDTIRRTVSDAYFKRYAHGFECGNRNSKTVVLIQKFGQTAPHELTMMVPCDTDFDAITKRLDNKLSQRGALTADVLEYAIGVKAKQIKDYLPKSPHLNEGQRQTLIKLLEKNEYRAAAEFCADHGDIILNYKKL